VSVENPTFASPAAYESSQYAALNLIRSSIPEVDVGVEGQFGEGRDRDGATGIQQRVQSSLKYRF
jgi:hypothetical protein